VGVAVDSSGRVFVADTWNRRVQIFTPDPDGTFSPETEWPVNAWYGTMPENKPYLALDSSRHVYLSDPLTCRLVEFNERGLILAVWEQCGEDESSLSGPTGLALDSTGGVWVSDSHNNRLVHYPSPNGAESAAP
jgi:sugar lactone lactonase YvrE